MVSAIHTVPAIPHLPIVGNIAALRADRLAFFCHIQNTCGELGIFHFGSKPVLMVGSPTVIQEILVHNAHAAAKTDRLRRLLQRTIGNGLLTLEGQSHREQRRLLAPVFQPRALAPYVSLIEKNTTMMIATYGNQVVNRQDTFRTLAMTTIHQLIFGNALDDADQTTIHASWTNITTFINDAMAQLFMLPLWIPIPKYTKFKQATANLTSKLMDVIAQRRANPTTTDIISLILNATNNQLTNEQIRDHVLALFTAGHDPLAMALTWIFVLLAAHQDSAEKVVNEIENTPDPLSDDVLQQFPYTLQCIKEVLRLYPPAYVFTRRVICPIEISAIGRLPIGLTLGFSPYAIHRNEHFFPNAEQFDPDRWLPENEALRPRYSYLPFGAGPHQCLGMHLAMIQLQTMVITIIRHCGIPELIYDDTIGITPTTVLEPNKSIDIIFTKTPQR